MKHYLDYKKQLNKFSFKFLLILFFIFSLGFFLFSNVFSVYAQTALDIQNKINQKDADIQSLEKEIAAFQIQLDSLGQQKNSLSKTLKELDLTKKKLSADISVTQKKIDKTTLKIENLGKDINTKERHIANNINSINLGLKEINEFESGSIVENLLSYNNFSSVWNDVDSIISIREKTRDRIKELKQIKGELEDTRKEAINAKNELLVLKSELADQKKIVEQNALEKKKLLTQTKNSESNYQKILKARLVQKDALEKELRDYESQLKYILDPSKLPDAGIFSWPLDNILVTQFFGKTEAGKRLYANGTHSGVDFRASVGTPVKAMAKGVVTGTGDIDLQCPGASFGRYVFITYDNGLSSVYGHLSLIKVSAGEKVERGQMVAYSGNTGHSTAPHLHVSVYAPNAAEIKSIPSNTCQGRVLTQPVSPINAYLDPLYFLPASYAVKR
ncbi:MAG: peptidoglycan DD-metalloendopeptidase family protein [Candidatus Paceibacterota bacterium]|jgi:murein DD-endopeptidase MepM/ murein hydrolase activator NlpD